MTGELVQQPSTPLGPPPSNAAGRRQALYVLAAMALIWPLILPGLWGAIGAQPRLAAQPAQPFALASPWDRVVYDQRSREQVAQQSPTQWPTQLDPRALDKSGSADLERLRLVRAAMSWLARTSDEAACRGDKRRAEQVLDLLDHWARNNAFRCTPRRRQPIEAFLAKPSWISDVTGEPGFKRPPEPVASWSPDFISLGDGNYNEPFILSKLATCVAVSLLQVRASLDPDSQRLARVKRWLRGDLMQAQRDFAIMLFQVRRDLDHHGRPLEDPRTWLWGWQGAHNKVFGSTLAVMALAIAADNHQSFDWACQAYQLALSQIGPDGLHRATLYEKGPLALMYHCFILEAAVPAAILAECNDRASLADPRLRRLASRVGDNLYGPADFERRTGLRQETDVFQLTGNASWSVILRHHHPHPNIARYGSPLRFCYPLYIGAGQTNGGHPRLWSPERDERAWVVLGQAGVILAFELALLLWLAVPLLAWWRGRWLLATLALLPPLALLIGPLVLALRPRTGSHGQLSQPATSRRELLLYSLLLMQLTLQPLVCFWSYGIAHLPH